MNWETIKDIYRWVLIRGNKFEYLGGDKYRITSYHKNGQIHWKTEYKNNLLHGKSIIWFDDGQKYSENKYGEDYE